MPTLKDIANQVGVSVSTVSRVINNDTSRQINAETKKRIWEVVLELGYKPNEAARNLVQNKKEEAKPSMQVGCIVMKEQFRGQHPYFSPILSGLSKQLQDSGYTLTYIHSLDELQSEQQLHRVVTETHLDGMILIGEIDSEILTYIRKHIRAVVGIDLTDADVADIAVVDYDRIAAVQAAIEHLIAQGHRKIGFIGGDMGTNGNPEDKRFIGFKYAMHRAGLEVNPDWVIDTEWLVEKSYSGMMNVLESQSNDLPTAMFAASDTLAIAAMRAVSESGLRIPEDMSFIGVDNIELSEYTNPPLSTVAVPKYEIGVTSAKLLVQYINGTLDIPVKVQLPFQLVIRQSSVRS
ncbi:LacI family DNA-binding transcriptional regulator [Bacillus sp. FJAT-28004]|uniref:LacI family DNA-binding transcriptional regulator n=1 Tax=Bacillus sp. FJAT-28004 TaxID=1679165 RepID=UPI0006B4428A|nr:LacI family DNA-binding transcriptional regulator [Bacillus sp. FJAT-28004]